MGVRPAGGEDVVPANDAAKTGGARIGGEAAEVIEWTKDGP